MPKIDYKKLDELLLTENLGDILRHAEEGDVASARYALFSLAHCLSTKNINPQTGETLPVPLVVRDYLSRALYRLVGATPVSADVALNLTPRTGKPKRPYYCMLLAGYLVKQGITEHGLTVEQASAEAVKFINTQTKNKTLTGPWEMLAGYYEDRSFIAWYYKVKDDLERLYAAATIE